MDAKPNRVPQIYGYTVCVIAVITFLICATVIVNNLFDLANPIASESRFESLTSFEAYRANQRPMIVMGGQQQPDTASEATLRKRYDALREDRIGRVRFQAWKSLTTSGLLMIISLVLFGLHWRWMRKLGSAGEAAGG